jgi:hypothetical protein
VPRLDVRSGRGSPRSAAVAAATRQRVRADRRQGEPGGGTGMPATVRMAAPVEA